MLETGGDKGGRNALEFGVVGHQNDLTANLENGAICEGFGQIVAGQTVLQA